MNTLTGKTVVITGAAGGIGSACVHSFLEAGARVAATDIGPAPDNTSKIDGENYRYFQADISNEESVVALQAQIRSAYGGVDILVNNAAVLTPSAPVHQTSLEEFERMVAVNLRGVFLCCKYFYPALEERKGNIVNVSSMAGIMGEKDHAIYAATKGAINALTQSMAVDCGPAGVRVNAVCPGGVNTPNAEAAILASPNADQLLQLRDSIHALGATATPEQVASVIVFLSSPGASFMTGALVPVSGGAECGYGIKY